MGGDLMTAVDSEIVAAPTRYAALASVSVDLERDSLEHLQQLVFGLEQAREQERAQFARDLHDELGSALTGLKMVAARLGDQAPGLTPTDVACRCREMTGAIDEAIETMRRI